MASNRNALAELAESLTPTEVLNIEGVLMAGGVDLNALCKAQRIVAELEKVSDGEWIGHLEDNYYLCRAESRVVETAVGKCRAIAEEGNDDAQIA